MNRDLEINLELLKEETIEKVIECFKTKLENGFLYDGKIFPMSISDQVNYTNLLLLPNEAFPQNFPCKDFSTYEVTAQNTLSLYQASARHKMSCEGNQNRIINSIKNCATNQEVIEIFKFNCL